MPTRRDAGVGMSYENLKYQWDNEPGWKTYPLRRSLSPDQGTGEEDAFSGHGSGSRRHHLGISLALDIQATVFLERHDGGYEHAPGCDPIAGLVYPHTETIHPRNKDGR